MPLLYPAIYTVDKPRAYGVAPNVFVTVLKSAPVQALASSKLPVLFCSAGWHGGTRTHDIRINSPPFCQLDYTPISNETHQFHFVKTYRRLPPQFDKTKLIFFSSSYRKLLFASLCIFKAHHLLLPQKVCNVAVRALQKKLLNYFKPIFLFCIRIFLFVNFRCKHVERSCIYVLFSIFSPINHQSLSSLSVLCKFQNCIRHTFEMKISSSWDYTPVRTTTHISTPLFTKWSEWWDSNPRPRDPKSRRLPTGVHPDIWWSRRESNPRPKFLHVQNILTQ